MSQTSPIRPTDDEARALARSLIRDATFAALAVTDPVAAAPSVTRIAIATCTDATPLTLISDLSSHTAALRADPRCAMLLGEPAERGDPLTHPRLTLHATAEFIDRSHSVHFELRAHYLAQRPKAKLYVDFADFSFVRFVPTGGMLNGGFGKAFQLEPADLLAPPELS